jgi:hypothetical protein
MTVLKLSKLNGSYIAASLPGKLPENLGGILIDLLLATPQLFFNR